MHTVSRFQILYLGFTIFAMFFGAGNIVFPLALGQYAKDQSTIAVLGLCFTAVIMPILGFISMILYNGEYRLFFKKLGRAPGFVISLLIITLLGPLGSAPRCIVVAFSTFKEIFPFCTLPVFSAVSCMIIFLCTYKKRFILDVIGKVLTPLLLLSLFYLVIQGVLTGSESCSSSIPQIRLFAYGLEQGYHTMDLLAAFFFSSTIFKSLSGKKQSTSLCIYSSLVGAFLLCCTYFGFAKLASYHQFSEQGVDLLGALSYKIAGVYGAGLVCVVVTLACFTTAIALISSFVEFVQREVYKNKTLYKSTLFLTLLATFTVSTFEFTGISSFLSPVLQVSYPVLILLTFVNLGTKILKKRKKVVEL